MSVTIGVDIGQKREHSAICAAEMDRRQRQGIDETHYVVRYLERLPIRSPYPAVAERTAEIAAKIRRRGGDTSMVYFDATGLGEPLLDLFNSRVRDTGVAAVYFTHGDRRTEVHYSEVILGKAYLVARLQTLLQTRCLHLPRTAEAETLAQDLLDYEIRVDEDANERYGAFKVGAHDDLVTALGLAVHCEPPVFAVY